MKTLRQMIETMEAKDRGERIGKRALHCGSDTVLLYEPNPDWNWFAWDFEVMPKPRTRPFTREDMNDEVRWIRKRYWPDGAAVAVIGVDHGTVVIHEGYKNYSDLAESWEWSPSMNGPWHPFTVEET